MNTNPNNQLPDEVILQIEKEAADKYPCTLENHEHRNNVQRYRVGYMAGYTSCAAKLHQAQQEIEELKEWKESSQKLLEEYRGRHKEDSDDFDKAVTLLEKFISRHEAGLLPDRFIYNEIKQYLDGTK